MDLKTGGIIAAAAFILSFLIGLASRSTMPFLIVWPLVFALVFFAILNVAKFLISHFMPELFGDGETGANILPGSVVNIMEGDNSGLAEGDPSGFGDSFSLRASDAADAARPDDSGESLEDISLLSDVAARNKAEHKEFSIGMDQKTENGYNAMGDMDNIFQPVSPLETVSSRAVNDPPASGSASPALFSGSDGSFSGLDGMAGLFSDVSSAGESDAGAYSEPPRKRKSSNKDKTLEGDFSPKDIAGGIRTVLKKDKEA